MVLLILREQMHPRTLLKPCRKLLCQAQPSLCLISARDNSQLKLCSAFKEMIYDTTWGDDATFVIADNTSTTEDDNTNTILVGTKSTKLPIIVSSGTANPITTMPEE